MARQPQVVACKSLGCFFLITASLAFGGCASEPLPQVEIVDRWPAPVVSNDPRPVYEVAPLAYVPPDGSRGAELYRKCAPCHSIAPDGPHGIGPKLFGVAGGPIAAGNYAYSDALLNKDGMWDDASLDAFIASPRNAVPGSKMSFRGIENPQDRADLILFLKSQR